ncbi:MAG TPA: DUF58 domain-containing protein [candidate division Zixibacteria bacterium]|nr:DUF58 domain-containing protein [candidate division Zixibacteria bacterium]
MRKFLGQRRTGVLALILLSLLAGLATGRDLFFNITYLLALLLIASFLWAYSNMNWVYVSRVTRTRRTQVGRPLEERFTVRNTSILPKLWLEVRDYSTLHGHFASKVVNSLGSRSGFTWRVNTVCRIRGRYRLGPMTLRTSDPFGMFPMERDIDATTNVVVYPLTADIHHFALPIGMLPGGDALRRRTHYVTTNASGVRDYAPGDSFSRIHWPSTARRNRLIVKEFELDPMADIWLVIDMAVFSHVSSMPEDVDPATVESDFHPWLMWKEQEYVLPEATEEYTVTVAASLTQYFLRRDRAVGLLAIGQTHEVIQPDRGERQMNRIFETLAVLRADGQVSIQDLLDTESQLFPRGTTVIAITPTVQEEWATSARQLSRRGLRVVSILIEPESFGGRHSGAPLADLLRASSITTYVVNYGDDITAALSQGGGRSRYHPLS